jgi:thiazole/oxazole-forming peptide maturase SagD family component
MAGSLRLPEHLRRSGKARSEFGHAGGCSFQRGTAEKKAIGEAVERHALLPRRDRNKLSPFSAFERDRALDPTLIVAGTRKTAPNRSNAPLTWIEATSLPSDHRTFVPLQLVDVPHLFGRAEPVIRAPITTGGASGLSLEACSYTGLLEVIERDAFMTGWLLQLPSWPVRDEELKSSHERSWHELEMALAECRRYRLDVVLRRLVTPSNVPVVVCALFDATGVGPFFTLGAAAAVTITQASLKALLEALQIRTWLRADGHLLARPVAATRRKRASPTSLQERAIYAFDSRYAGVLRTWLAHTTRKRVPQPRRLNLRDLIADVTAQSASVFFVDLTPRLPEPVRSVGFFAGKIVVPEFQPLYLSEPMADHAWERFAQHYASFKTAASASLQTLPHPFL